MKAVRALRAKTLRALKALRAVKATAPPSVQPPGVGTVDAHGDRYRANRAAVVALVAMAEHLSLISSLSLSLSLYISPSEVRGAELST